MAGWDLLLGLGLGVGSRQLGGGFVEGNGDVTRCGCKGGLLGRRVVLFIHPYIIVAFTILDDFSCLLVFLCFFFIPSIFLHLYPLFLLPPHSPLPPPHHTPKTPPISRTPTCPPSFTSPTIRSFSGLGTPSLLACPTRYPLI